ncbi:DUF4113 domain-containing protein [Plesiomonas shigelloides]
MRVIDRINHNHRGKIHFASRGSDTSEWMMKREHLSPRYTTSVADVLVADGGIFLCFQLVVTCLYPIETSFS